MDCNISKIVKKYGHNMMAALSTFFFFFLVFQPLVEYIKKRERFESDVFSMYLNDLDEDQTAALISLSPGNTEVFAPANSTK